MAKAKIEKEIEVVGETTELVTAEEINPAVLFGEDRSSLDILLEKIKVNVLSIVPDVSTAKGRKAITANVSRVTKSKTTLEKIGKDYNATEKERLKKFDSQRKYAFTFLEDIQKEARKTLTEWEDKEKTRVAKNESIINTFVKAGEDSDNWMNYSANELRDLLDSVEEITITKRLQEFEEEADIARTAAIKKINQSIQSRTKYDEEQAELAKLRKDAEEADRQRFEANEKLEKDKAIREAEIKANTEKEAAIRTAEKEKDDALKREEEAKKQAVIDLENAEKQKQIEIEAAAQAERDRIEAERLKEEQAAKDREADKNHKKKINNEALAELLKCGIDEAQGKKIITAIAKNKVPHVKISY